MGQAKRRGSFEQRKAEAIAAGRIKTPAAKRSRRLMDEFSIMTMAQLMLMLGARNKPKKGRE